MFSKLPKIFHTFSRREQSVFFGAAVLIFIGIAGLIFGFIAKRTTVSPVAGGHYQEGSIGQPTAINPILAKSEIDQSLVRLIFSNLPALADKIESSDGGRIWKIRLKDKIFWQDGQKLTSDDVIFTVEKIQDPDSRSPLFLSWQGVGTERASELELKFSIGSPYAFFEENLKNLYILPKHLFADVPATNWRLSDYNLKPIGSGFYKFVSYGKRPDGFITDYRLEANQQYFQPPLIKNLEFRFFIDQDQLANAFNAGEIDGVTGLSEENLERIKRPYQRLAFILPSYYAVFLNQNTSLPLKEPVVRNALGLAINRQELVKQLFADQAKSLAGPLAEASIFNDDNFDAANRLLEKNGWQIDETGLRQKVIKNKKVGLEFKLILPPVSFLIKTADFLSQSWRKIGVKTEIVVVDFDELNESAIKNRDYQMLLFGNILNPAEDLFVFWHSSQKFYPGLNISLYQNPKADQLIENIRGDFDPAARRQKLDQLQNIFNSDHPAIFLYSPYYLYLTDKNLGGLKAGFINQPADRFLNISDWYVKTTRVLSSVKD